MTRAACRTGAAVLDFLVEHGGRADRDVDRGIHHGRSLLGIPNGEGSLLPGRENGRPDTIHVSLVPSEGPLGRSLTRMEACRDPALHDGFQFVRLDGTKDARDGEAAARGPT